jgi:hypothetical protein
LNTTLLSLAPPRVPSIPRPSIPRPSRPPLVIQHHTTVIQNNHYFGGYGGGYFYHPWYHPVFVWPTYGNYSAGAVGGVEQFLVVFLVLAIVGLLGFSAYKLFGGRE